ncbi:hypothetical protein PMAYCL1PPCAC_22925, partial [Pristionchus mayeri]
MVPFNANDPKYHSCCCGAHVTKLVRILIVITLFCQLLSFSHFGILFISGCCIVILGAIGVFKESRAIILIYIGLNVICKAFDVTFSLAFWNLAQFIKDRDVSQQLPVVYEVRIDQPIRIAASALGSEDPTFIPVNVSVPFAPVEQSEIAVPGETPPPYEEK